MYNGASVVGGSEPFAATGALGQSSLSLPQGASAVSPPVCIDYQHPTMRFFQTGSGVVSVALVYNGNTVVPAGSSAGTGAWTPGALAVTGSGLPSAVSGSGAMVNIVLTATNGASEVDDVYVDPYHSCC
jgi:hypothetical protein